MTERFWGHEVHAVRRPEPPTREEGKLWIELVSEAMKKPEADQFFNSLHEDTQNIPDETEIVPEDPIS